jgi:predicted O-methyltransferase YrrM
MADKVKRVVWSNKSTRNAVLRVIDAKYVVKRQLGTAGGNSAGVVTDDVAEDLRPFHRYMTEYGSIEGWFKEGAIATWDSLLAHQTALDVRGNLMEIGVAKGKSAALMALRSRAEETCVFIDLAIRRQAIDVIETIRTENNVWLQDASQNVRTDARIGSRAGTFRWIHVDGEHSGRAVLNDLDIAGRALSPEGVICLDDFMSPAYPQVTMSAFRFLDQREEFSLFLNGFNKGYICRRGFAPTYLRFLKERMFRELERRRFTDVTVWKTTDPDDMNCFGQTRKYLHYDSKGPDWAPHTVPI